MNLALDIGKQIKQTQRDSLDRLINHFGTKYRLAKALEESPQTVQGWDNRGRISATAAKKAEKVSPIKKEELRPDVADWS